MLRLEAEELEGRDRAGDAGLLPAARTSLAAAAMSGAGKGEAGGPCPDTCVVVFSDLEAARWYRPSSLAAVCGQQAAARRHM